MCAFWPCAKVFGSTCAFSNPSASSLSSRDRRVVACCWRSGTSASHEFPPSLVTFFLCGIEVEQAWIQLYSSSFLREFMVQFPVNFASISWFFVVLWTIDSILFVFPLFSSQFTAVFSSFPARFRRFSGGSVSQDATTSLDQFVVIIEFKLPTLVRYIGWRIWVN